MRDQKPFYEIEIPKKTTEIIIQLLEISDSHYSCMHRLDPHKNKRCNLETDDTCAFCGMWTCHTHFDWKKQIWLDDNSGFKGASGFHASPCDNCSKLRKEDLLKIRTLRLEINQ